MRDYVIRRILLIIPTFILVTFVVFLLVRFVPGNVVDVMAKNMEAATTAGTQVDPQEIRERLGLDVSLPVQYGRWMGIAPYPDRGYDGVFEGSLGVSLWTQQPVKDDVAGRIPVSLELGILAEIIALLIAFPIGIYSAMRQDTGLDYLGRTISILFISVPSFWIATMVIVYPSIYLNWMPPLEYTPFFEGPIQNLKQMIIPAFILGMALSGVTMRMTRTMMLEVLRQDYIRTAWAKGLKEGTIIRRHALKNALIPVVTVIGFHVPVLIGGAVILEQIFNLPGVGRLMIDALSNRDYPIICGINFVLAGVVLLTNLVIDMSYAWLDPRVSYK